MSMLRIRRTFLRTGRSSLLLVSVVEKKTHRSRNESLACRQGRKEVFETASLTWPSCHASPW
eukprot:76465-Amphidinium_carterae.1